MRQETNGKTLDEIIRDFWEQVANSPNGEMAYDFSIREHRQVYYNDLDVDLSDGEEGVAIISQAMDQDVKEKSRELSDNEWEGFQDRYSITPMMEKNGDSVQKKAAQMRAAQENRQVGNLQSASYLENKEGMMISVELLDKNHPENAFYANSGICRNGRTIDLEAFLLSVTPQGHRLNEYETRCTFSNWGKVSEESEERVLSAVAKYCADSYAPATKIIESIEVKAPVKWASTKGNDTIVCYNRTTEAGDAHPDYVYPKVIVDKSKEPKKVTVHLPFQGEIKLHAERDESGKVVRGTAVRSVNTQQFKMSISPRDEMVGGETVFDKEGQKEKLDALFYFDEADKVEVSIGSTVVSCYTRVKWELDRGGNKEDFAYHNWGKELLASHVTNDTHVEFHAAIPLQIYDIETGIRLQALQVQIQSSDGPQPPEGTIQNIPYIWLWWGCVSGDTVIRMADGSEKPICEIRPMDVVRSVSGRPVQVRGIYSGTEETVIRLETEGGKSLRASKDHPVKTRRGILRADELTAGDLVWTVDGPESIRTLDCVEYGEKVYNLEFTEKTCIYANGIISGDMLIQQEIKQDLKEEAKADALWEEQPDPLTLEIARRIRSRRSRRPRPLQASGWNVPPRSYYGCPFHVKEEQNARILGIRRDLFPEGFTFDVWVYITGTAEEILSQKDGFCLGVRGNQIVFSHPETGEVCAEAGTLANRWNNLFVTYAAGEAPRLILGANGRILCEAAAEKKNPINDEDFFLGKALDGYIRRVVLYDSPMPVKFLRSFMFRNVYNRNWSGKKYFRNILAFLDLNGTDLMDSGPNQYPVRGQNFCVPGSLVNCYLPSRGSFAFAPSCEGINPGGFASGEFGIYLKFYYKEQESAEAVLFSNGLFGSQEGMSLYLETAPDDTGRLHLALGEDDYVIAEELSTEQWIDLAVSYDEADRKITAYINGDSAFEETAKKFVRKEAGEVRIGNAPAADGRERTCTCYFWAAAVFDKTLGETEAREFYRTPPYVYEKNLKALYFFGGGCPAELVSGRLLELKREDKNVQQDVIFGEAAPYFCRIAVETPKGSKKAQAFFRLLSHYFGKRFGLHIHSVDSAAYQAALYWIDAKLLVLPQVSQLFEGACDGEKVRLALRSLTAPWLTVFAELTHMNDFENKLRGEKEDQVGIADVAAAMETIADVIAYETDERFEDPERDRQFLALARELEK